MTQRETPEQARARLDANGLRPDERVRLWQRIEQNVERRARPRPWLVAAPIATAAVALVVWLSVGERPRPDERPAPVASAPSAPSCELDGSAGRIALPTSCEAREVAVNGDHWLLQSDTVVEKAATGARVVRGKVRFQVQPRKAGAQFEVGVSHGRVRVIGTVFTVVQNEGRGSVTVSEGVIEFAWDDGARENVRAGETLHWPRAESEPQPEPEAQVQPDASPKPSARPANEPSVDADQVIGRLLQLRSQRRHDEAVQLLSTTLQAPGLSNVQRERISYELGRSLEAAQRPACGHWQRHLARFGAERHEAELTERLRRCEN